MCSIGIEQIFVYYNALELGIPDNLIRKKEGPGLTADFLTLCIPLGFNTTDSSTENCHLESKLEARFSSAVVKSFGNKS